MRAGLSSTRCGGEPISQGVSPTTITAITAVPSAASDGVVAAVSSTSSTSKSVLRIRRLRRQRCALDSLRHGTTASPYRRASRPPRSQLSQRCPQRHRMAWSQLCPRLAIKSVLRIRRSQGISPTSITAITAMPSAASDGLVIASTVQLPVGGKVNRPIDATRTDAIVICLNQLYFEPKFSRQLVSNSAKSSFTAFRVTRIYLARYSH